MQRHAYESVPGCAGEGESNLNYCYDPYLPELTGFQIFSGQFRVTPEQASGVAGEFMQFLYFVPSVFFISN